MKYNKGLSPEQRLLRKKEYAKEYLKKNRERIYANNKRSALKNKEKHKKNGWFHYTQGKKCNQCGVPVTNASTGKCVKCALTKIVKKDMVSYLYRQRNPEKIKTRKLVYQSIKVGRIKRLPCEVCGKVKSEAHHEDYSKPFQIIWLCKKHHSEADVKLGVHIGKKDKYKLTKVLSTSVV
jgi:hypothetical protein